MDEYMKRRANGGGGFSRKGTGLSFRESNHDDRNNIQYCNRLGCSTRLNAMKANHGKNPEKPSYPRSSFRAACSKAIAGSSSKPLSASSVLRKSRQERENQTSPANTVFAESSGRQKEIQEECSGRQLMVDDLQSSSKHIETEEFKAIPTSNGIQTVLPNPATPTTTGLQTVLPDFDDLESGQAFSTVSTETSSSLSTAARSRPCRKINQLLGSSDQYPSASSSVRRPIASRSNGDVARPVSQGGGGAQRYGMRNLGCTSISDILPLGCSSSDLAHNRRVDTVRKRPSDGESSSRGKGIVGSSNGGYLGSSHNGHSGSSTSHLERSMPQPGIRRGGRIRPSARDGAISVRTRRATSGETRMGMCEQGDDNTLSLEIEPSMISELPDLDISIPEDVPESSSSSSAVGIPPALHSSFGRPGSSSRAARNRMISRREDSSSRIFHGPLVDRDIYRHYNMEGIAEVLLALERIEHDEELSYEQLLVFETNLLLGGVNFHDQHRELRMDIDNMSYEELLALEEKMGSVSTALSEEALAKCVKRNIYIPASNVPWITDHREDDIKCSICQEEYVRGDEIGKLACEHRYHVGCIHQWLRLKNWCPICKTSVSPS